MNALNQKIYTVEIELKSAIFNVKASSNSEARKKALKALSEKGAKTFVDEYGGIHVEENAITLT